MLETHSQSHIPPMAAYGLAPLRMDTSPVARHHPGLLRFMMPFLVPAQLAGSALLAHPTHRPSLAWLTPSEIGEAGVASPAAPGADRGAILAMAGEFQVTFAFDETVVLAEGYTRTGPHRSGAREVVLVVEDAEDRIVLQHILASPSGHATNHWPQDWLFEARGRLEFVDDQRWELRPVPEERVAGGWTHEQDNTKALRRPDGTSTILVRVFGFNDDRRTDEVDFSPALAYWAGTEALWAPVRTVWDRKLAGGGAELLMGVDGMPLALEPSATVAGGGATPEQGATWARCGQGAGGSLHRDQRRVRALNWHASAPMSASTAPGSTR